MKQLLRLLTKRCFYFARNELTLGILDVKEYRTTRQVAMLETEEEVIAREVSELEGYRSDEEENDAFWQNEKETKDYC